MAAEAYQLAQLNLAWLKAPIDSPQLAEFVANIGRINGIAESAPGFVWRLRDESSDTSAGEQPFGPDMLANLSVWRDVAALRDFAYRGAHVDFVHRRREWFQSIEEARVVLWWIPAGHIPSLAEAAERLAQLREHGSSRQAFTFANPYPAPMP